MEAYKSTCSACGRVYFWTGLKSAWNAEQAARKKRDETICHHCGAEGVKTELDFESPAGKDLSEQYQEVLSLLFRMSSDT